MEETVEIEYGNGRKRPFDGSKKKKDSKREEVPKRRLGVVQKKPDIQKEELDELEDKLSSSMLARLS